MRRPYSRDLIKLSKLISLRGRKTLITGAGSGIGRAIAKRFAEAGSDLMLLDIDQPGLSQTREILNHFTCLKHLYTIDLTSKKDIDSYWENLGTELPDILINNVGIYPFKDFLEMEPDYLQQIMDINLNSAIWMCQKFIKSRMNRGGIIINTSSIEALLPFKEHLAHYSITKLGIIGLTRSLARDYGKMGFRINVVLPGAIKTKGTDNLVKYALKKFKWGWIKTGYDFQSRLALGRWGYPDEVAKVVLFLASDMASYIQGVMLPVDGGFLSS